MPLIIESATTLAGIVLGVLLGRLLITMILAAAFRDTH
jgi:hypothetical protein